MGLVSGNRKLNQGVRRRHYQLLDGKLRLREKETPSSSKNIWVVYRGLSFANGNGFNNATQAELNFSFQLI